MTSYSNPRLRAVIENWPLGRDRRGTATFHIEQNKRGERAVRTTTGAPKALTYAGRVRIVDGDDGRTYLAHLTVYYDNAEGHISIMRGDMKYQHEVIHKSDARYAAVRALFEVAT